MGPCEMDDFDGAAMEEGKKDPVHFIETQLGVYRHRQYVEERSLPTALTRDYVACTLSLARGSLTTFELDTAFHIGQDSNDRNEHLRVSLIHGSWNQN